jgi:hypothetical protein
MSLKFLSGQGIDGNVGIGTDSPGAKLQIAAGGLIVGTSVFAKSSNAYSNGNISLDNGSTDSGGIHFYTGDNTNFGIDVSSGNFRFVENLDESGGSVLMNITTAGAVKFNAYNSTNNTGTPTYLLGTDSSGNIVKTNTIPGSGAGPYLPLSAGSGFPLTGDLYLGAFNKISGVTGDNLVIGVDINNSSGASSFDIQMDGSTSAFYINNSRNVGIGTPTPGAKLEVAGNVLIQTTGAVDNLKIISTDTTVAGAPDIVLFADAPAATGDTMGDVLFQGKNGMVPSSTAPLSYGGIWSKMVDKDNNHSSLFITTHKGNGTGAQALTAAFSAKGVNNSATGTLLINPSSVTDVADYNLEVKGDALIQDNFYVNGNVGIGTASPKAKLDINGHFCVDSKTHSITDAFTTCLTVNLTSHTGCHVVITAFGDWGSHSSAAYRGEFFLQNGANSYNEPGIILRQDDNTSDGTDQIICQIVDPSSTANPKDFEIQIRHTDTVVGGFSAQLTYTVQGKFNSIT